MIRIVLQKIIVLGTLLAFTLVVHAAEFTGAGTGAIPDGVPSGLNVTFNVAGMVNPVGKIRLRMDMTHNWIGDVTATLISPGGTARLVLFGRTSMSGIGVAVVNEYGSSANIGGSYIFADDAPGDWWATATLLTESDSVPSGNYRTSTGGVTQTGHGGCSTSLEGAFAGLTSGQANGTWTLNIADLVSNFQGNISAATLTILDDQETIFTSNFDSPVLGSCRPAQFDYTGSGRTSYLVVRNTGGGASGAITWFIQDNDGTALGAQQNFILGIATNYFIGGDFDGDGIWDGAVWSAGNPGIFTVRRSSRPTDVTVTQAWGVTGDDPLIVGDYDGDNRSDFAVYRPGASSGLASHTLIHPSGGGPDRDLTTGENAAFPNGGVDYTGDGKADIAIQNNAGSGIAGFRIYDGTSGAITSSFTFGASTDVMVTGNHTGTALSDITTARGNVGNIDWTTRDGATGIVQSTVVFGASATDFTLSGDFDGDGLDDYSIWRPSVTPGASKFSIRRSSDLVTQEIFFGQNGDYPVAYARTH